MSKKYQQAKDYFSLIYHLKSAIYYCNSYEKNNHYNNIICAIIRVIKPKLLWVKNEILTNHLQSVHTPDVLPLIKEKFEEHPVEELAIIEKIQILTTEQLRQLEPILDAINDAKEITYEIK